MLNGEAAGASKSFGVFGETVPTTAGPGVRNPVMYGFTGREYDFESGLNYHRARMYNPGVGRWLSQDPIGLRGRDANFYRYVGNRSLLRTDPKGKIGTLPLALISGGVGALVSGASEYARSGDSQKALRAAAFGGASGFVAGLIPIGIGVRAYLGANALVGTAANFGSQLFVENRKLKEVSLSELAVSAILGAGGAATGEIVAWRSIRSSWTIGGPLTAEVTTAELRGIAAGAAVGYIGETAVQGTVEGTGGSDTIE